MASYLAATSTGWGRGGGEVGGVHGFYLHFLCPKPYAASATIAFALRTMSSSVLTFANNAMAKRDGRREDLPAGWAYYVGNWFGVEGSTNSFYLVERPRGPLLMYWRSWALQEGTRHLWARCQKDHGMPRDFYEQLEADLIGLTRDDLAKARDGLTKLKQTLRALVAKAKKTVHNQRKAGLGALKKAGAALRKERERLFKDYAPGAEKFNKVAKNYYFLRGKGVARKVVSPQEGFRPLDLIVHSTGISEVTGSAPTSAHCYAIQVLGPDAPPLRKAGKCKAGDSLSDSGSARETWEVALV